ncbi:MAG TPA: DUF177 domain-containing protein [Corynebacteriales bacterium]|nr:DUF177 domain-containing protein [Mycobacteriales bacterium]
MTTSNTDAVYDDFLVDLRPLGREVGNQKPFTKKVKISEPIGLDMIAIPAEESVTIDGTVEAVAEGVFVNGTINAPTKGQCVHCLSDLAGTINTSLTELFLYPDTETAAEVEEGDDDVYVLDDPFQLELKQAVIDAVGLALPFAPSCTSVEGHDCPETDVPAPDGISGEENDLIDPRWADLEKFKNLATLDDAAQDAEKE